MDHIQPTKYFFHSWSDCSTPEPPEVMISFSSTNSQMEAIIVIWFLFAWETSIMEITGHNLVKWLQEWHILNNRIQSAERPLEQSNVFSVTCSCTLPMTLKILHGANLKTVLYIVLPWSNIDKGQSMPWPQILTFTGCCSLLHKNWG